jgi:hypothetical protein
MKKTAIIMLKSIIIMLSVIISACESDPTDTNECTAGVLTGDYTISSASDMSALKGYTKIQGGLTIAGYNYEDLKGLECLSEVTANLTLGPELSPLCLATLIAGGTCSELTIDYNNIKSLEGLSGLKKVGGSFTIKDNPNLKNADALKNLQFVGNLLYIIAPITSIDLGSLASVGSRFEISDTNIEQIGGAMPITSVNTLCLKNNQYLADISGLLNIGYIDTLQITGNPLLPNIDGLRNLTSAGYISIIKNDLLADLDGLSNLASAVSINITNNTSIKDISGLGNLVRVDKLRITDNINSLVPLTSLDISSIKDLIIQGCNTYEKWARPADLSGLSGLTGFNGNISITESYPLDKIAGLDNLTHIGGDLTLSGGSFTEGNESTGIMTGLEGLKSIGGNLTIKGYPATELNGLNNLESIGGYLEIKTNSFTRIRGLQGISQFGGDYIDIRCNMSLSVADAEALRDRILATGWSGTVVVRSNGPDTVYCE